MYYYIINPAAGRGAISGIQDKLRERLAAVGIEGEFAKTTGPGDATQMTKLAIEKGHKTVVAVGGDGTVNEVINGITDESVAIGIIPLGRSNLLARHLGIGSWQQACEVLAARRIANYGLILAGHQVFLSTLNLSFENQPAAPTEDDDDIVHIDESGQAKSPPAPETVPVVCQLSVDGDYELESPLVSLTVANQKFDNPTAENKLVITLTDQTEASGWSQRLRGLIGGSSAERLTTSRILADRVTIETSPPTGVVIDGKTASNTPITVRLTDRTVRFITEKQISDFKE
jgi:diacylglycerol kinase family enzyme